jgi:butyryl-CoA dehydrogenase
MVSSVGTRTAAAHAVAVPYLRLWGLVAGGWQLARAALIASRKQADGSGDPKFLAAKIATARFYAEALLPQAASYASIVTESGDAAMALSADLL